MDKEAIEKLAEEYMSKPQGLWSFKKCFIDGYQKAQEWISMKGVINELPPDVDIWAYTIESKEVIFIAESEFIPLNYISHYMVATLPTPPKN